MHSRLKVSYPLAITMWDFSWLERRWPGAGYESWDEALDALVLRGYDAVRIDAYPHFIAHDPRRTWELLPVWTQNMWGAPARCQVQVLPALLQFMEKCAVRGIKVGLSTWFRQDTDDIRMRIKTPNDLVQIWRATLQAIQAAGLMDTVLYLDLANEFPVRIWAPFLYTPNAESDYSPADALVTRWMDEALTTLRAEYPTLPMCFSLSHDLHNCRQFNMSTHDLLEIHIWMTQYSDFYDRVGYHFTLFDPVGYDNMARTANATYAEKPDFWHACLRTGIDMIAAWSAEINKPLMTTECWAVVDYKDFPMLSWDWVKALCEVGVRHASASGRWIALGTSNFCGPQFVGMWRDIEWHQRMTEIIHSGTLPD